MRNEMELGYEAALNLQSTSSLVVINAGVNAGDGLRKL